MTYYTTIDSPLGDLLLVGEKSATAPGGTAIRSLSMTGQRSAYPAPAGRARMGPPRSYRPAIRDDWQRDDQAFAEVRRQLDAYFAGERQEFDLEFRTHGSEFQERIWQALDEIPYGTTTTYGELATRLGVPRADVRDLGGAIAANPLLVLRPCHRVIGSDGTLKGYAGGVERKRTLLEHEGALQEALL
ncbi:methylated-DNA--[protein]-cysteine S-methyltransferase [Flindersiella endophytica]